MLGFDPISSRSVAEIKEDGSIGSSEFPIFLPSINSLLSGVTPTSAIGGFEAPYAFSLGMYGAPSGAPAGFIKYPNQLDGLGGFRSNNL